MNEADLSAYAKVIKNYRDSQEGKTQYTDPNIDVAPHFAQNKLSVAKTTYDPHNAYRNAKLVAKDASPTGTGISQGSLSDSDISDVRKNLLNDVD